MSLSKWRGFCYGGAALLATRALAVCDPNLSVIVVDCRSVVRIVLLIGLVAGVLKRIVPGTISVRIQA